MLHANSSTFPFPVTFFWVIRLWKAPQSVVAAFPTGLHVPSLRSKCFRASSSRKIGTRAKKKEWRGRGRGRGRRKKETLARKPLACEQQTYFRSSLLSVRKREGQKRRPEVRLLFAGKQTPRFWKKLRSPTNAASDWWGAGIVDYLALETSIKPGMLCLRALKIWLI